MRTLLKREESYSIHALIQILQQPGISTAQIAENLKMPPAFMAKVMAKLVKGGFVDSRMGRNGGMYLITEPQELTLLSIIEAISGPLILDACQVLPRCATQQRTGHCNLKLCWLSGTQEIREVLKKTTLAQLGKTAKE